MNFEDRLKKAIQRGQRKGQQQAEAAREGQISDEELKRLHSQYRLELSDRIEECITKLAGFFPGFQVETIFGERGWGAACKRDDIRIENGKRQNDYSRLEMTVRPFSSSQVLDLYAKGTVRNKETFNRSHYESIADADSDRFIELIDKWILQYAEAYSAQD